MKSILFIIIAIVLTGCACKHKKEDSELNLMSFKVSKDEIKDSMDVATRLLDKMDYGNGASIGIIDNKLRYRKGDGGFHIIELTPEISATSTVIEPLTNSDSKNLFNLMIFLNKNHISNIGKRNDNTYYCIYRQTESNPNNDFDKSRFIVYLRSKEDINSKFIKNYVILDRYKNLLLLAPKTLNNQKLPMDEKSFKKRAEEMAREKAK
jgi:hypothetical protein